MMCNFSKHQIDKSGYVVNHTSASEDIHYRRRKKQLFKQIKDQMEFYFSEANLSRDRHLGDLILNDRYIPMKEFLNYNKIRQLTNSTDEIALALKGSKLIETSLTGDLCWRSKKFTKIPKVDVDAATVYVESLPPIADHEWIRSMFEQFGKIVYVSMPRYKETNKFKGFAFIQFDMKEHTNAVIAAFKEFDGVLLSDHDPATLASVRTYIEENSESKIAKMDDPYELVAGDDDKRDPGVIEIQPIKRSRKKKSKANKGPLPAGENLYDLKIMMRADWGKLRNSFLNKQRDVYREVKRKLAQKRAQNTQSGLPQLPGDMNFYGGRSNTGDDGAVASTSGFKIDTRAYSNVLTRPPKFPYQKGIIVHIRLEAPLIDVKSFKEELMEHEGVKYVDAPEGTTVAYVRTSMPLCATILASSLPHTAHVLSGIAETEYWQKIHCDRAHKYNKSVKPRARGRDKLVRAATRVFFD